MQTLFGIPNVQTNVPLAPFTTYKIGGPAQYYVAVKSADELADAVVAARTADVPYFILGCGANILIRDGGIKGLVIHNQACHANWDNDRYAVTVESGVIMADLITMTCSIGWSGLEHFAGIPSTVGGAVWQNLHFLAPDRERTLFIEEVMTGARILTKDNQIIHASTSFFEFGYDDSILHHQEIIVLDVDFQLTLKPIQEIQAQIDANLAWRNEKQPKLAEFPSCGSVFKKIEGVGVGRLIDQCGLKGTTIGGAQISPHHANFFVNLGGAKANDVLALIQLAKDKVKEVTGYQIETEIQIVGSD